MQTIIENWEAIQTALFIVLTTIFGIKKGK